ncbi:D-lactate dehydrogenase (cytochrome) [Galdieria sulphuraria]|uniref:D-lactate dehydrogenase (cytochrome) n=1 Tax=Galdieria sulphuraria TaxID=130081 RepID=M2XF58_GALSU|nr:D-lactate dehydrogenase (cytochrome) [Galdieria sulphuraria]EME28637.1 D-lactate dehydrogenase (cytochrome) [Galdieria sulphuraria]|eukprot:XP_005705157.1 D-lactate dehydrogenase (cytochrome) [Galdieria sulphuraria]
MSRVRNLFRLFSVAGTRRNFFSKSTSLHSSNFQSGHSNSKKILWLSGTFTILASTAFLNQRKLSLESPTHPVEVAQTSRAKESGEDLSDSLKSRTPASVVESCFQDLQKLGLGERITRELHELETHGSDISFHDKVLPDIVIYPQDTNEVSSILSICNQYQMPVVAYGGATSLEGHILPVKGGVVLDFSNMKRVIRVNLQDMDVTVEPGISWNELNDYLRPYGLFFPPDPGAGASIGGMVATSCGGTNAVKYGTMKENVLSLKVVLADGKVIHTRQRVKKSSAGYDLTHLFIGSEGTLGIVTEAVLKLHPIPESHGVAMCYFDKIEDATSAVIDIVRASVDCGRIELMDDLMVKAVNKSEGLHLEEKPVLLFELAGSTHAVNEQMEKILNITKNHKGQNFEYATEPEKREGLWRARKDALWSAYSLRPDCELWTTDVCVPVSRLSEMIHYTKEDLRKTNIVAPLIAHAGDGNFHLVILVRPNDKEEMEMVKSFNDRLVKRAISMEGTCTGEHGIGEGKREYLVTELGEDAIGLMRTIKEAFDPNGILNPGKVFMPKGKQEISF